MRRHILPLALSASILGAAAGCATLPKASDVIDGTAPREPPQILSAQGYLSPETSKALMERLKRSVAPTDMMQRYTAVIESVSGSPLTHGNKVTLLIDGPATYAAMFRAMESMFARDLAESDEIRLVEWKRRPLMPRIKEWVAHLFARWL